MKSWSDSASPRVKTLGFAAAVLPACVLIALLLGPTQHLAARRRLLQSELAVLHENVYRAPWLDSTRAALTDEVGALHRMQNRVRRELSPQREASAISDPLRREAQAAGCEVLRLSSSVDSADGLRAVRLRWEVRADYPAALRWFRDLRERHPEAYFDEVLLRTGEAGAKLSLDFTLVVHTAAEGARP